MIGKMSMAAFFGVAATLVRTVATQCTGGIEGVQSTSLDVCCTAECGTCGGPGCTPSNTSPLTSGDCCATEISESGVLCSETGTAPCILSTEAAPADSVCDNGQTGVQDPNTDVCCPLECGDSCGGDGCGTIPGVDASQCCAAAIVASGIECDGTTTPCVQTSEVTASTCPNGIPGVADGNICCAEECNGVCGGVGCGAIAGTNGASDCCSATIAATGQLCGTAPCVMNNGTFTPSPVALPTALPTMEGATIAPTAGSRDFAFTTAPTSAGTAAPAHGFKTEMPSQSPAILPPDLEISAAPTLAGDVNATVVPTPASSFDIASEQGSASDSAPIVAGVVSAAAGAALIALAILLKRRRTQEKKAAQLPALPPTIDDTTLEQGPDQRSRVQFPVIPQLPTVHLDSDNENGGEMP